MITLQCLSCRSTFILGGPRGLKTRCRNCHKPYFFTYKSSDNEGAKAVDPYEAALIIGKLRMDGVKLTNDIVEVLEVETGQKWKFKLDLKIEPMVVIAAAKGPII